MLKRQSAEKKLLAGVEIDCEKQHIFAAVTNSQTDIYRDFIERKNRYGERS